MKHIYLAGPDVFRSDAVTYGQYLKQQCNKYGFVGHFPLDNVIEASDPDKLAEEIRMANIRLIEKSDIIVANLSPFRGPEPDSGTVFEVGYALGLGKRVIGYSSDLSTLKERTQKMLSLGDVAQDHDGLEIEDFGLTHNLMFAKYIIAADFEEALKNLL